MAANWTLARDAEGLAWLTLDRPDRTTNTLSRAVLDELMQVLDVLEAEQAPDLLVLGLVGAGRVAPGVAATLVEVDLQLAAHP